MMKLLPIALFALLFVFCSRETKVAAPATVPSGVADANVHPDFTKYCASCHGAKAESFIKRQWKNGNSRLDIIRGIRDGYPDAGMQGFKAVLSKAKIEELAAYIVKTMESERGKVVAAKAEVSRNFTSEGMKLRLDSVATNLDSPWGMTFLPNGDLIFTEKAGSIWRINTKGVKTEITGAPRVKSDGQGGLLDVELHPKFAENQLIYFTYSKPKEENGAALSATTVLRARLVGNELQDARDIFVALPFVGTGYHFGSRMEFGRDGYLYVTVGERGKQDEFPQALDKFHGKVHRITENGDIPTDNPFYNTPGAVKSIWTYGHRNPQGLIFNTVTGDLWEHEHGPRGGDELNLIQPGKNYGWPVVSYGTHYDGRSFTDKTAMAGIEPPVTYWVPSIAPCGMAFVNSDRYPAWKGDLLVGSLSFQFLNRCDLDGQKVVKQENLLEGIGRVRAVAVSPDGYIYVSVENPGVIYNIVPVR